MSATGSVPGLTLYRPWANIAIGVCAVLTAALLVFSYGPVVVPMACVAAVPLAAMWFAVGWVSSLTPLPVKVRAQALAWGATVAVIIAVIANTLVAVVASERASIMFSAPIFEEAAKGGILVVAWRYNRIRGPVDAVVLACLSGVGFAAVENVLYLSEAASVGAGQLAAVAVGRLMMTPFIHPMFSAAIGLAVGLAATRGRAAVKAQARVGYAAAALAHCGWNSTIVVATAGRAGRDPVEANTVGAALVGMMFLAYGSVFLFAAIWVLVKRSSERGRLDRELAFVARNYDLGYFDAGWMTNWRNIAAYRAQLNGGHRRRFDATVGELVLLAQHHRKLEQRDRYVEATAVRRLRRTVGV